MGDERMPHLSVPERVRIYSDTDRWYRQAPRDAGAGIEYIRADLVEAAVAKARSEERAKIVAWLDRCQGFAHQAATAAHEQNDQEAALSEEAAWDAYRFAARCIQAGDHDREDAR